MSLGQLLMLSHLVHPLLYGSFGLLCNVTHLITKKILWPILNIAEHVNLKGVKCGRSLRVISKVN